ncbi:hypothetical protein RYH80_13485 [Halobaculum sp. MBLA0147]|uniref:hypothetical protein n=1 Tax=Halobaculum sp. MBLA0147 TaxID=3079934 RepID=UPI003526BBC2
MSHRQSPQTTRLSTRTGQTTRTAVPAPQTTRPSTASQTTRPSTAPQTTRPSTAPQTTRPSTDASRATATWRADSLRVDSPTDVSTRAVAIAGVLAVGVAAAVAAPLPTATALLGLLVGTLVARRDEIEARVRAIARTRTDDPIDAPAGLDV